MSVIELPAATKRSLRFKRFSWNRAGDGTFPPIDAHARRSQQNGQGNGASSETASNANDGIVELKQQITSVNKQPATVTIQQGQEILDHTNENKSARPGRDIQHIAQNATSRPASSLISDNEARTTATVSSTTTQQKKSSKHLGKKRKGVYLGPSWDDEAGALPTSANSGEVDFDTLLSQMQSHQRDDLPSMPAPSKRKKLKDKNQEDGQAETTPSDTSKRETIDLSISIEP